MNFSKSPGKGNDRTAAQVRAGSRPDLLPPEAAGKRDGPPLAAKRTNVDVPVPGLEPGHTASKAAALPITPYRTERIECQRRSPPPLLAQGYRSRRSGAKQWRAWRRQPSPQSCGRDRRSSGRRSAGSRGSRRQRRAGRSASQYRREPSAERLRHSSTLSLAGRGRSRTQRETELLETPSLAAISS